ncbi:MAG: chemotaxis protein [Clostridia bacterium]|jgi:two-component system chemotaxis response regulator CheV|nr:chemotaxis protein [Clostridia bacterium]MCI1999879.1 chemotaxis protein [Clostridia bacterium]MCI2014205.1 chemotaxis protein [Clostridia bacterium]
MINKDKKNGEILLESGTNEIEIMVFKINGNLFGINVAKVKEIMMSAQVTPIPLTHPAIEGVFKPRGVVITVFDLPKYLYGDDAVHTEKDIFIITNFNKILIAFRVTSVEGIFRLSWEDIQKPDKTIGGKEGMATGITQIKDGIVTILDFEKIVSEVAPSASIKIDDINKFGHRQANNSPIVIVEDSIMLSKIIIECLTRAGFTNINKFDNGKEAWNYLETIKKKEENIEKKVSLVITDIEMPIMDGYKLTKLIKDDEKLKEIPVIIFSSMINDEIYAKGKSIGADEQVSKPDIGNLVGVIDYLLDKKSKSKSESEPEKEEETKSK